jgi:hypothetical protein
MKSVNIELSRSGYLLELQIREEVRIQVNHKVWNEVWDCVDCQVWLPVKNQLGTQVRDQTIAESTSR